ncbi:MAG: SDR family oxidoreductase [Henriciella sp.]
MTQKRTRRIVLITGCSRGIGLASAIAFAENGDKVYASVRDIDRASELRDAAKRHDGNIIPIELDVTKPATIKAAIDHITSHERVLDIVVNNAGTLQAGAFESLTDADIRAVMETNFFGVLNVTRQVLPTMRAQSRGLIMMMSSVSGWAGLAGDSIYAASKFALEGFTEAIRHEVARWGIKLALIEPAGFRTDLISRGLEAMPGDVDPYAEFNQRLRQNLAQNAKRGGDPDEVARRLIAISKSSSEQFRWPVGGVAEQVQSSLFAGDDTQRDNLLKSAAQIEWWLGSGGAEGSN